MPNSIRTQLSRRRFLSTAGGGFGMLALTALQATELCSGESASPSISPLAPKSPNFQPKAKRVLWLFVYGGLSHIDLFDPKPDLQKYAGQPLPDSFGNVMTRRKVAANPLLGPVKPFQKHGESGLDISIFCLTSLSTRTNCASFAACTATA